MNDVADELVDDRVKDDVVKDDGGVQMRDPRDETFVQERPWGQFEQFVSNERVTVKIITVQPGHRLSLQTHENRGEFWQVLDGPMEVTVGDRTWVAASGEKVWAPQGSVHRMANHGDAPGRMLEVAFGDFDEADIVRLQDDYAR
ncbi:phosphomannose isomerase type II C-terminal cupin domain [Phycicoccus sp. Root563]|uniref:phosphomannose isomerase type II C-terminal cupin domain n=1 Tax=Phycicoccus sp. Root563 TaxID=1736562 RepID=UPI000B22B4E2